MSILDGAFSFLGTKRSVQPGQSALFDFNGFLSFGSSSAGVTKKSDSLKISAFYDAVNQISSDIARIPFKIYEKNGKDSIERPDHPAAKLLKDPNPLITSYHSKKLTLVSMIVKGNSLWRLVFDPMGYPVQKIWIDWDNVFDVRLSGDGQNLLYYIRGYEKPLLDTEVLHYKGMTLNGFVGVSVVTYAAEQLGLALKTQAFSIEAMNNKGVRQGVVETEKTVNPEGKKSIISGVQNAFSQKDATRVAILDEGLKWKPITLSAQEIQLIEQQRFAIEDVARWLNIPLHKIKSMTAATNNNIEQQSQDYLGDTLAPWVTNIEEENAKKLIPSFEKGALYCKGLMEALLRADMKTRAQYYKDMIFSGVMNRNEVRSKEEMNPGPELLNEYLTPTNMYTEKQLENNIKQKANGTK